MPPSDPIDWEEITARPEKRARKITLILTLLVCAIAALLLLPFWSIPAFFAIAKEKKDRGEPPPETGEFNAEALVAPPTTTESEEQMSRDEILDRFGFGARPKD